VRLLTFLPLSADGYFKVHIGNTDYTSYLSEIHPQMPELHAAYVPTDYRYLLRFLLQPVIWQQKGSVPHSRYHSMVIILSYINDAQRIGRCEYFVRY
jgi:hypothetical protein